MELIKKSVCRAGAFLLCLLVFLQVFPARANAQESQKTVRVGWYEGTHNITGPNGEKSGYSYEYEQTLAAYTGWVYEYVSADWTKLIQMLQNGDLDLLGGVSYTKERADSVLFSELPMGEERYYLYADLLHTDISAKDLTTLNDKRIGMLSNSLTAQQFSEWEQKHGLQTRHVTITGADDAHALLAEQELDGLVVNESPQWEKENLSAIAVVGGSENYFIINPGRPDLKDELDTAMRRIEQDKPFYKDDLYKRYFSAKSLDYLNADEQSWLQQHGTIRVGYLKNDVGVSLLDGESEAPVGIIQDYLQYASDGQLGQTLRFSLTGFDSQKEQLQALQDDQIDMIFHVNQNPYEAEQNKIALSNTVFEANVAALTAKTHFEETAENTVALSSDNLLSKWYISYNYPQWNIREYASTAQVEKAVRSGEADCFIVKAGQSAASLQDNKIRSVFLTEASYSSFAVRSGDTVLLSILNKTLKSLPQSALSGAFSMYENAPQKVTLADYVKDNLLAFTLTMGSVFLVIVAVILKLLMQARKAQQQAEAANAAKSNFMFNMSHDIRTPMNAILGYNELMKKELTNPKLLDYQQKIEQSGKILLSIINNVLDMARIESGRVELDENYASITDILEKLCAVFEIEAQKKKIHFACEAKVEHPHILCDATKVQEIFVNLISNAIKYTPRGGSVTVRLQELPCEQKGSVRIKAEVIDTGIGMSKEFLPSLFVAFARERNTTMGKVTGTGLGMPIVKNYVEMMGGTIEVESEQGMGTHFTVILQQKVADPSYYTPQNEESLAQNSQEHIQGKRILLAEDNDLNAEIAMTILEDMGLTVERVEDGIKCVDQIEQTPAGYFDLVLMDIQMPNMDGYKATQAIRRLSDPRKAQIPIIAMTANAFEEDKKMAIAKGMNGHIAKPISVEKIESVMLSLLK